MAEKKICEQCHDEKDIDVFRKVTNQYTGVHPMSICKECYNRNNEDRKRRQEEEWQQNAEERKQRQAYQQQSEEREAVRAARKAAWEAEERRLPESNPTEVTYHAWIYAIRKQGSYPEPTERSGKWLIFLSAQSIDRYWAKIKEAVEQGQLGEQTKVSTRSPASMPPEVRRKKEERGDTRFVVCVYTYDYADEADVMRVRQVLKELGIQREIIYKADADTRAGSYGADYTPKYRA